jgi:aryl-alcohol dehydrogenase-like predicted oxidoreductase
MECVSIESADVRISRLAFGTGSLHHLFGQRDRMRLLSAAHSAGISHFDTSPFYGYGMAEHDLGTFMDGRRGQFTVATKVGLYPPGVATHNAYAVWTRKAVGKLLPQISSPRIDWSIKAAERSLHESLRRLRGHVDFLFLHEPNSLAIRSDEFLRWLEDARSKGKIRFWGLAGLPTSMQTWLDTSHPLAAILQAKDSLENREADVILEKGRALQFTYGYLSSASVAGNDDRAEAVLREALARNAQGAVIVSTRRYRRVSLLAEIAR